MDTLPIDISHPAVRDYLTLVRLQVLTPLSCLVNIATVFICATVTKPTIGGVMREKLTALSPQPSILAAYIGVLFLGQIGYCILLVMASKPETKSALTKGVGMSLVLGNFVMALWAICWVMQWFLVASILQGILLVFLLYSSLALYIYHPVTRERPLDAALIHAPIRFFLALSMMLLFPYCLIIALHFTRDPGASGPWQSWTGFGIVLGTNLFAFLVVITQRDIVWCVAATWISVILWSQKPKPTSVFVTTAVFTAVHPIGLVLALAHAYYRRRSVREGGVALPRPDEHPGLYRRAHREPAENAGVGTVPTNAREDVAALWD